MKIFSNNNKLIYTGGKLVYIDDSAHSIAPMTLRFAFSNDSTDPTTLGVSKGTWTKVGTVGEYTNVWDWTYNDADWSNAFNSKLDKLDSNEIRIIATGDLSYVTNMYGTFFYNKKIKSVCYLDLPNVTDITAMFNANYALESIECNIPNAKHANMLFEGCSSLTNLKLYNTDNLEEIKQAFTGVRAFTTIPDFIMSCENLLYVDRAFRYISNIESGMLEFYNKNKDKVISNEDCFKSTGIYTESGRAERAQIPQSWGGDKAD